MQGLQGHFQFSAPVRERHRLAFKCHHSVVAHVRSLFHRRRPATVARLVIAALVGVAVDAVELGRRFAHVFQECLERIKPAFADRDAASAVSGVSIGFLVRAAGLHVGPDAVRSRSCHAVRRVSCRGDGCDKAAATLRLAVPKLRSANDDLRSAVAGAIPECCRSIRRFAAFGERHCKQAAVADSCPVLDSGIGRMLGSHANPFLSRARVVWPLAVTSPAAFSLYGVSAT